MLRINRNRDKKIKPDSTSAALILSSKIRMVFWLVSGLFLMASSPIQSQQIQVIPELLVTPETLKNIPSEHRVIVDTRSKFKFLMGHIPGAVNLNNWRDFTTKKNGIKGMLIDDKDFIAHALGSEGLSPKKSIIIYGDPGNPWRTDGRFFWMFERYGFKKVAILDGGMDAWKASNGPVESGFQEKRKDAKLNPNDINLTSDVIADKSVIVIGFTSLQKFCAPLAVNWNVPQKLPSWNTCLYTASSFRFNFSG